MQANKDKKQTSNQKQNNMSKKTSKKNTAKKAAKPAVKKENPAAVKAREEKAKRGEMIALASVQAHELSRTYEQSTVDVLGQMLGKKFDVTLGGASIKKGVELTEAEAARAVATLAEVTERNDTVRSTTMLALGGVVIGIKEQFGEDAGDKLIQQAVSVTGKSKHTVQEAERVVRWANSVFKGDGEAIAGLSYTHLQELKNGSQDTKGKPTIEPADLRKIVKKVQEGKVVSAGKKASGEKIEQRKVLSCAETRELLVEAGGGKKKSKKPKDKSKASEPEELFFYINDSGDVKFSIGLNHALCKKGEHLVIDVANRTVLQDNGAISYLIQELEKEEPKQEEAKEEKPKKEDKPKSGKKKSSEIPE